MGSSWKRQGVEEPSYHDDRSMGEHAFLAFTQSERNSLSKLDKFCQSTRLPVCNVAVSSSILPPTGTWRRRSQTRSTSAMMASSGCSRSIGSEFGTQHA